jgi:sugar fermentation stimulation protein A
MRYRTPLLEGRFVRRYKRFFADVELPGGEVVVAHCPNSGSMAGCQTPGTRAWVRHDPDPKRKLAYTLEIVESFGALACVNTALPNGLVEEAIRAGVVAELAGYDALRREVKYGLEGSRIDLLLERGASGERCYVEVKNVTLGDGGPLARFPDAVTERGTKHLRELMAMVAAGHRAVLLFCGGRADARAVGPADDIDPVYGRTLREAAAAGVELLAYRCDVSPEEVRLVERIPVDLAASVTVGVARRRGPAPKAGA